MQHLVAIALVVIGILIIAKNIIPHISLTFVWPGILVLLGVWLLWQAQPAPRTDEDVESKEEVEEEHKEDKTPDQPTL